MAEPRNAATASAANDEDDADDLYADLDEQVAAALAAAGESGGSNARDSDPATDGEGEVPDVDVNEAIDLGDGTADYSSSDEESDDGLHIVLNEDDGAPLPPPPSAARTEGCVAENDDGEDSGSRVKGPSVNDGSCDKPWRQHGIDLKDYFNFGLDEQGWKKYWLSMKQVRQGSRSLANVSSGLEQESCKVESVKVIPKAASYSGHEGRDGLAKGRAIHVEDSVCERVPSADMWRPMPRDSGVVIQVNMMHSPSNQSTSDDSSTLNHRHVTTESACRLSVNQLNDRHLKDSSIGIGRVVDKEVHNKGSSEFTGNKLYRGGSAHVRNQSSSPGYSETLSEESKEDLYFKRANRHSDSMNFYEDTKLKDEHVKSYFYCSSSESDHGNSKNNYLSPSYASSPVAVKHQKAAKLSWRDEDPFAGQGRSRELSIYCKAGQRPNSGHKAIREQKKLPSAPGRRSVFVDRDQSTDNYTRRCGKKNEQKISSLTSQKNNYRNAVDGELYSKQHYPHLKRVALKNDEHYLNNGFNDHHGRSSHRKFSEEDATEGFSLAKDWRKHPDDRCDSMLEAEISSGNAGQMYRERHYEEMRGVRHGLKGDDEFLHYSDYRFRSQSPDVRARYSNRGMCAKSIHDNLKYSDHLALYPQANLNNSQNWPSAGLSSIGSRNRCIGNKRIHNAKMVPYRYDGYHQKKQHHDSSLFTDSIPQSALYTDAVAETGRCILPVKRKLHAHLGSMNHKEIADLSLSKRRFMHDQSVISDRKIYAVKLNNSSKESDTEATFCSYYVTKSTTVSNIGVEARHELGKGDNILMNDKKIKALPVYLSA
ncbi:hypothetical protein PR202_gb19649 [Eleusine coracana subsp. coracana]|uniref:Pre-mRNA polyadenylation factor Fip1 domain-containing protein n=1 Tax=Eleusine coracana subsp. coracana TaxID=191504 RepID=A0AAV5F9D7_ELECO|nr:hypothetical protein PR202_gb19649 [Eleusine coracana subsp. coracana]